VFSTGHTELFQQRTRTEKSVFVKECTHRIVCFPQGTQSCPNKERAQKRVCSSKSAHRGECVFHRAHRVVPTMSAHREECVRQRVYTEESVFSTVHTEFFQQ
jgi:hypothetical protein